MENKLRVIAIRHLKDPKTPISQAARRQLIGDWAFDEIYSQRGATLRDKPALQRRLGMLQVLFEEPRLLFSRTFRGHARKLVKSWIGGPRPVA